MEPRSDVEQNLGISLYLSNNHKGFNGVVKARYSDFLVHEVGKSGEVAYLRSTDLPSISNPENEGQASRKRKHISEDEEEQPETNLLDSKSSDPWVDIRKQMAQWFSDEVTEETTTMLQSWEGGGNDTSEGVAGERKKFLALPQLADKDARRTVHQWIKSSSLSRYAVADTHEGKIRIWHKRFETEMPNYGKFDRQGKSRNDPKSWPKDRPNFLRFVLYKENTDTAVATKEIVNHLRGKVRLGYAGMKDKRGITSQFCTLYRRQPQELLSLNKSGQENKSGGGNTKKGGFSVIRVGNFEYVSQELQLGTLQGNRFDIVLRNVSLNSSSDEPSPAVEGNKLDEVQGVVDLAAKSLQTTGFINYFGMQRFGKNHDTHEVGIEVLKGNFEAAVDLIMRPKGKDEHPRVVNARKKWQCRFESLPDDGNKAKAESQCAKQVVRDFGRWMTCETAILNSLKHKPLDYKRAFSSIPKPLRLMFLHAVQSLVWNRAASHRIEQLGQKVCLGDLVQVKDGKKKDPQGDGTSNSEGKSVKVVTEADLDAGLYETTDIVLPLVGTKVQYPENETGKVVESILKELSLSSHNFKNVQDREITLGGDYRKVICKPVGVSFKTLEYSDPIQPLLQTDLMALNGEGVEAKEPESGKSSIIGVNVGFALPSSSYATIALREFMRCPSSSEYQQKLSLV